MLQVWKVMKLIIDPNTQKKVSIVGSDLGDIKKELFSVMPPDIVPAFLGGTRYGSVKSVKASRSASVWLCDSVLERYTAQLAWQKAGKREPLAEHNGTRDG